MTVPVGKGGILGISRDNGSAKSGVHSRSPRGRRWIAEVDADADKPTHSPLLCDHALRCSQSPLWSVQPAANHCTPSSCSRLRRCATFIPPIPSQAPPSSPKERKGGAPDATQKAKPTPTVPHLFHTGPLRQLLPSGPGSMPRLNIDFAVFVLCCLWLHAGESGVEVARRLLCPSDPWPALIGFIGPIDGRRFGRSGKLALPRELLEIVRGCLVRTAYCNQYNVRLPRWLLFLCPVVHSLVYRPSLFQLSSFEVLLCLS